MLEDQLKWIVGYGAQNVSGILFLGYAPLTTSYNYGFQLWGFSGDNWEHLGTTKEENMRCMRARETRQQ